MEKKVIRVLLLVKSIDGGTGTFVESLQKIDKNITSPKIKLLNVILEHPFYRDFKFKNKIYISKKNYPLNYTLRTFSPLRLLMELLKVRREIVKFKPDVVIGVDVHANLILSIARFLYFYRAPQILTTHIDLSGALREKSSGFVTDTLFFMVTFFYNRAEYLVSTSSGLSKSLKNSFRLNKNVKVIYYGIMNNRQKIKENKSGKSVLTVARLVKQKDIKTLLLSMQKVLNEIPEARLSIIGDGPLMQILKKQCISLKIENSIHFLGWKKNVISYMEKSDIFVLSSIREGFGYVLLEAMSCALPVISTDAKFGPSEILDKGKYGVLVKVGDISNLSKNISRLLKDSDLYKIYSKKSKERSRQFSEKIMLENYTKLIYLAYKK